MAEILHCCDDELHKDIAKVITLNEPGHTGLRVRYTDLGSAALMVAYIFRGRCRHAMKLLSPAEARVYHIKHASLNLGEGI